MRSERLIWAGLVVVVLLAGWLVGHSLDPVDEKDTPEATAFRAWFWERRTLDLLAQVGLLFAGALGVAALLPSREELDNTDSLNGDNHVPLA
ncbi:MAG: hypothetical protein K8R89_04785 [Anaerolineae bacterium]|nr:hypothetical protein [Anaerolineae bacterium]